MTQLKVYSLFIIMLIIVSCSTTKHVPNGEYLLDKVKINTEVNDISKDELSGYIRQKPNARVFGVFRMQLGIYNLSGNDTTKWINRTLRKIGDEPVLLNRVQTKITMQQLTQLYKNKGYINTSVDTTITYKNKKAKVDYHIKSNKPYRLGRYDVQIDNELLTVIAQDTSRSVIKPDMLFDTDVFEAERNRISSQFRELGYYNFNKELLIYNADSTLREHKVNVTLVMRDEANPRFNPKAKTIFNRYKIRSVTYLNRRDLSASSNTINTQKLDTVQSRGFTLIGDGTNEIQINTLIHNTYLNPGTIYNDVSVEKTYSALNMLGAVKYVNISFKEVDENNLDCQIVIVPSKTVSMSVEAEATFTDGFWGVRGNIGAVDRNFMRGAETLSVQGSSALEWQNNVLAQEWGALIGLRFPVFLMPFVSFETRRNLHANTELNSSYIYQFRPGEFTTINLGGGMKYRWLRKQFVHNFELANLSYVYFPSFSEEFRETYLNTGRYNKYNYEDHFILRMGYSGSYTSFNTARPLHDYSTSRYSVESAGNLLYGINNILGNTKTDGAYRIFNIRYAQYFRAEYNTTRHQIIDASNRFVFHLGAGVGVPYGNAEVIPYERRFYAGGANSVRGWSESTLGPGVYKRIDAKRRDYNQVGDVKLDLSMEYRAKMFWVLEGAAFLDAGNIWTIRNYPEQLGGAFQPTEFLKQLAIAYGGGLRLDFSFFIFRLDVGVRLFDPVRTRREQWRIKPDSGDFAFHLAIGYPF
jgi:outer membrane protein assembly factor BamA